MGTATSSPVYTTPPRLVGSFIKRVGAAPSPVRVHARNGSVSVNKDDDKEIVCQAQVQAQGPYCILVGPVDSASQETLEALYRQARDAYYSGTPLIVDDMFDRVELKLRRYGSKYVVKYPRCSLRQQSTYADAEEYLPQAFALATIWVLFLAFGSSACFLPVFYVFGLAYQDAVDSGLLYYSNQTHVSEFFAMLNGTFFMVLGSMIGYPIALASVRVLQGLWRNDLVALKGSCPNCGEEVFAFVRSDQSNSSPHRVDCHVCESILEFHTKTEQSLSRLGRRWVYGRVYLVSLGGRNRRQRRISDLT